MTAKHFLLLSMAVLGLLMLPAPAGGGHMPLVLTDVTAGEAEGKGTQAHGWLILKFTGLPPRTDFLVEVVESSGNAPRPLGRVVTREGGQARLTVDLKGASIASGTLIQVRPVTDGSVRDVVLEGKIP